MLFRSSIKKRSTSKRASQFKAQKRQSSSEEKRIPCKNFGEEIFAKPAPSRNLENFRKRFPAHHSFCFCPEAFENISNNPSPSFTICCFSCSKRRHPPLPSTRQVTHCGIWQIVKKTDFFKRNPKKSRKRKYKLI